MARVGAGEGGPHSSGRFGERIQGGAALSDCLRGVSESRIGGAMYGHAAKTMPDETSQGRGRTVRFCELTEQQTYARHLRTTFPLSVGAGALVCCITNS